MLAQGVTLVSRYEIVSQYGSGGMGKIYKAWDTRLNIYVVIKENLFREDYLKIAFRHEAQLLVSLSHPSLPRVIDYFFTGEGQYLVMEFIDGDELATLREQHKAPFPAEDVKGWAEQLLEVLDYLHSQAMPIVHRDIKPSNIKISKGRVFLLDFGLAFAQSEGASDVLTHQLDVIGYSPNYSPLEQLNSKCCTPASDVYSLAATLYVLLTNSPPRNPKHRLQMIELGKPDPLKDLRLVRADLDQHISQTIMQALKLEIGLRPQTAGIMRQMMFPKLVIKQKSRVARRLAVTSLCAGLLSLGIVTGLVLPRMATVFRQHQSQPLSSQMSRSETQAKTPERIQSTTGEDVALLSAEARILLQHSKYPEALQKIQEARVLDPTNAYAIFVQGDIEWDTSDEIDESKAKKKKYLEAANKILELGISPQTAKEYTARAWAYLAKEQLDKAIADASSALDLEPNCGAALMIRATAKSTNAVPGNQQALESLADYTKAIDLMPDYAQALANRALTYFELGQYQQAIADYERAIILLPRASFYAQLGDAHLKLPDYDSADKAYRKALQISPKNQRASIGLAVIRFQKARFEYR